MTATQQRALPTPLWDLLARSLANSRDREPWLQARRGVVTATEAKTLVKGSAVTRRKVADSLLREKVTGETKFSGTRYTVWGNLREPIILEQLQWLGGGWRECGELIHAEANSRHAATPDGWRCDADERVELLEIKTSKHDIAPGTGDPFDGYWWQMQWQMHCTGAQRVLYVWERHDDDWSSWDPANPSSAVGPEPMPLRQAWIERDDDAIAKLVLAADEFLARLDVALLDGAEPEHVPDETLAALMRQAFELKRRSENNLATLRDRIDARMEALGIESESLPHIGTVTRSVPAARASFDAAAFKAAHPEMHAEFMKQGTPSTTPQLRLTPARKKAGA